MHISTSLQLATKHNFLQSAPSFWTFFRTCEIVMSCKTETKSLNRPQFSVELRGSGESHDGSSLLANPFTLHSDKCNIHQCRFKKTKTAYDEYLNVTFNSNIPFLSQSNTLEKNVVVMLIKLSSKVTANQCAVVPTWESPVASTTAAAAR